MKVELLNILRNTSHLLFPHICLHCKECSPTLFCKGCGGYFELVDPTLRCEFCFKEKEGKSPCLACVQKKRRHVKLASALDSTDPVKTFLKKLKGGNMPYLAKTAACFMYMQFERMRWEKPDIILPLPKGVLFPRMHFTSHIAKALASFLRADFQIGLRKGIAEPFHLIGKKTYEGKVILLIDDAVKTGMTLHSAASIIREKIPKKIYALTLAIAD